MKQFHSKYQKSLSGTISGWDRLALRGTIRWLSSVQGLGSYLSYHHILLKGFRDWAMGLTRRLRWGCEQVAETLGIRQVYLQSSSVNKEEWARSIASEEQIKTSRRLLERPLP